MHMRAIADQASSSSIDIDPRRKNARRCPIVARDLRLAGAKLHRFLNDPAFVRFGDEGLQSDR